jgi:hypothetical protein
MEVYRLWPRFAALFDGLKVAHGTGRGQWVKRPLRPDDWIKHLNGEGPGIGVAPLREDNTVAFAAIDLDEPDFAAAKEMQMYIPGKSFVERSRSGNAHVWVFFDKAAPAWLAMGVLKEATLAAGKKGVEVFPKNWDFARVKLGNYINLPCHGDERPILNWFEGREERYCLEAFIAEAERTANDPDDWAKRASMMQIVPPSERKTSAEFGTQKNLHSCAERIINGEAGIVTEGHQNATLFMLSKCLTNWEQVDHDEALDMLLAVADDLFDPVPPRREIVRILNNVERGQYTSTGCDDPLVQHLSDPACPIANPRST